MGSPTVVDDKPRFDPSPLVPAIEASDEVSCTVMRTVDPNPNPLSPDIGLHYPPLDSMSLRESLWLSRFRRSFILLCLSLSLSLSLSLGHSNTVYTLFNDVSTPFQRHSTPFSTVFNAASTLLQRYLSLALCGWTHRPPFAVNTPRMAAPWLCRKKDRSRLSMLQRMR